MIVGTDWGVCNKCGRVVSIGVSSNSSMFCGGRLVLVILVLVVLCYVSGNVLGGLIVSVLVF